MTLKRKKIGIIDYAQGNTQSVINSLIKLEVDFVHCKKEDDLDDCSHIILPGVGSFVKVMQSLKELKLIEKLNHEILNNKKFFLGICVGFQILFDFGLEQKKTKGLGWIKGYCGKFSFKEKNIILPHIGWNHVELNNKIDILNGIENYRDNLFYFVHSFRVNKIDEDTTIYSESFYHENFISVLKKENIYGVQFHPEKSQVNGLKLLENFCNL